MGTKLLLLITATLATISLTTVVSPAIAIADTTPAPSALATFFTTFVGTWAGNGTYMQHNGWGWQTTTYRNRYTFAKLADGVWQASSVVYPFNGPAHAGSTIFTIRGGDAFEAGQTGMENKLEVQSASATAATIVSHTTDSTAAPIDIKNELSFGTDGRYYGMTTYYRFGVMVATDNYSMSRTP